MPLRLELFDIEDVAGFCWHLIGTSQLTLSHHERDDLHAFLLSECWRLSLEFEPERGVYFSRFVATRLRNKTVDWLRKERGRTRWSFRGRIHERPLPELVSLDASSGARDQLEQTLGALAGDPAADRDPALAWLFDSGSRRQARDYELLGLQAPR